MPCAACTIPCAPSRSAMAALPARVRRAVRMDVVCVVSDVVDVASERAASEGVDWSIRRSPVGSESIVDKWSDALAADHDARAEEHEAEDSALDERAGAGKKIASELEWLWRDELDQEADGDRQNGGRGDGCASSTVQNS